jgi:hypothetical protein
MTMKKPAQLGENLLQIRPRKGEAKPQSEQEAYQAEAPVEPTPAPKAAPSNAKPTARRRRRLSDKKMQLNLKIDEKSLSRFMKIADAEGLIFGDLFKKMLDKYEGK